MLKAIGNDGIIDGFEVLEDFVAKYDSDTLPKIDSDKLDKEWEEMYLNGMVKCDNTGKENIDFKFTKGDKIYFEIMDWSKDLAFSIMTENKDKIKILK